MESQLWWAEALALIFKKESKRSALFRGLYTGTSFFQRSRCSEDNIMMEITRSKSRSPILASVP